MSDDDLLSDREIDRHLGEVARLAYESARTLCPSRSGQDGGCQSYHQVWPTLRALRVISGMRTEREFFLRTFRRLARKRASSRVLICGTADVEMLSLLVASYQREGAPLQVSVLDRCPTPLQLNRWFAEQHDLEVTTYHCSALSFHPPRPFDLICTHSFFSFLPKERVEEMVKRWFSWLADDGRVVASQLIRPNFPAEKLRFTQREAQDFANRAAEAARAHLHSTPAPPEQIKELALRFALGREASLVRSADHLVSAFQAAGFRFEHFAPASADAQRSHRGALPDTPEEHVRYQFCAAK